MLQLSTNGNENTHIVAIDTDHPHQAPRDLTPFAGARSYILRQLPTSGDLIIARLSPAGYEEIDRTNLLGPTSAAFGRDVLWMVPAYAGKCVFVRNDQELLRVSLAAP